MTDAFALNNKLRGCSSVGINAEFRKVFSIRGRPSKSEGTGTFEISVQKFIQFVEIRLLSSAGCREHFHRDCSAFKILFVDTRC
jgi:hypothetical protein